MPRTRSLAWSELKLGMLGVAAMALATALILAVGGQGGFFWQRYPLRVRFHDVQGLKSGAVVRLNGMEVGKVTAVQFAEAEVEVVIEVSRDVRHLITTDSKATMGTLSLLGEPIVVVSAAATGTPLEDSAYLPVGREVGVAGLATATSEGIDQLAGLIGELRSGRGSAGHLLSDEGLYLELKELAATATRVAAQVETGGGTLGALTQDPAAYQALAAALQDLSAVTERIRSGKGTLGQLVSNDSLARSLAGASTNVERITEQLARGEGTAGRLLADPELYERVEQLAQDLSRILAQLESGQGTAGQLLGDPRLYENVNLAATELRSLLADIRSDPRKYLSVRLSVF